MTNDPQPRNPGIPAREIHTTPARYEGKPLPAFITKHTITLQEHEQKFKGRPVYVFNNTKAVAGTSMTLVLTLITADQTEKLVQLFASWVPQSLSEHVSQDDVYRSSNLRTALSRKTLLVINPDFAEDLLQTPLAQQEVDKLSKKVTNDLSGYGDILEGKDKPIIRDTPTAKPEIPSDIREIEGIRAELVVAVNAKNTPTLISILSLAQVNDDLTEQEDYYVRSKISDKSVLEVLEATSIQHVAQ